VDRRLDNEAWRHAPKSPRFVDRVTGQPALFDTRAAALWDDRNLDVPEFDLLSRRALSFAGNFDRTLEHFWRGTHAHGARWAFLDWDFPGLRSAVTVQGRLNDRSVVDDGWRVTLAWMANGRSLPPRDGDVWRMFFGRFERLEVAGHLPQPQPAWCWAQHGVLDTHQPERYTRVRFSAQYVEA
jgi:hypothetical protein